MYESYVLASLFSSNEKVALWCIHSNVCMYENIFVHLFCNWWKVLFLHQINVSWLTSFPLTHTHTYTILFHVFCVGRFLPTIYVCFAGACQRENMTSFYLKWLNRLSTGSQWHKMYTYLHISHINSHVCVCVISVCTCVCILPM